MDFQETEHYKKGLQEYLDEGIDYSANTIKKADQEDLEQLACDSYCKGYHSAMEEFSKRANGKCNLADVSIAVCPICKQPTSVNSKCTNIACVNWLNKC